MAERDNFSVPSTVGTALSSYGDGGGAAIKVQIGEGGPFRRIPVHRVLFSRTVGKPSYAALLSLIAWYAFPGDDDSGQTCEVTTTYVDEDGDVITISTDEELEDVLFGQTAASEGGKKPPVLRLKAAVKVSEDDAADPEAEAAVPLETDAQPPRCAESVSSASSVHSERRLASGRVEKLRWDLMAVEDGKLSAETGDVAERPMKDFVEFISLQSGLASAAEAEEEAAVITTAAVAVAAGAGEESKEEDAAAAADFPDPNFIHVWHTCDACGETPIVGVRHHAKDRTDYDLCQGCFDSSNDDAGRENFVPEELDRDCAMLCFWARRFPVGRRCPSRGGWCQHSLRRQRRQMRRGLNNNDREEAPLGQTFAKKLQETLKEKQGDNNAELQAAVPRSAQDAREASKAEGAEDLKVEEKEEAPKAEGAASSSSTVPPNEDGPATSWRGVAESFSSAAAGSGDFTQALGTAAAAVAFVISKRSSVIEKRVSAIERQASEIASEPTRSAGGVRANGGGPYSSAVNSLIAAAPNAPRTESNVASEVQAAVDREHQRKEEEGSASASTSNSENTQGGNQSGDANRDVPFTRSHSDKPRIDEASIVVPVVSSCFEDIDSPEVEDIDTSKEECDDSVGPKDATSSQKEKGTNNGKDEWEVVAEEKVEEASNCGASTIAPPVFVRWAVQLEQLRQLGFTDDRRSIDALETLQAANLWMDSTDEVTVGDAINYLLTNVDE